jgi:hypothetical protein
MNTTMFYGALRAPIVAGRDACVTRFARRTVRPEGVK